MTVIELGELSSSAEPEPLDRPLRRIDVRRYGLALAVVLCLLAVTGSARPETRALPEIYRIPGIGEQFVLTDDALFAVDPAAESSISSYDARDGRPRWSRKLSGDGVWLNTEVPGLLMVPAGERNENLVDDNGNSYQATIMTDTIALDAGTGAERWRQRGEFVMAGEQTVVLAEWNHQAGKLTGIRLVRVSDGAVVWHHRPRSPVAHWTAVDTEYLATAANDGRLEVRRLTDGGLVTSGRVPWPAEDRQALGESAYVFGAAGMLFVSRTIHGEEEFTAHEPDTLTKRWSHRFAAGSGMFVCGRLICFGTGQRSVEALDARTGRFMWRGEGWDYARSLEDGLLLAEAHDRHGTALVEEATGRVIVSLGQANVVADHRTGQMVVVQPVRGPSPIGYKLSELDRHGDLTLRGALGQLADQGCQLAAGRLACLGTHRQLTVRAVG